MQCHQQRQKSKQWANESMVRTILRSLSKKSKQWTNESMISAIEAVEGGRKPLALPDHSPLLELLNLPTHRSFTSPGSTGSTECWTRAGQNC